MPINQNEYTRTEKAPHTLNTLSDGGAYERENKVVYARVHLLAALINIVIGSFISAIL